MPGAGDRILGMAERQGAHRQVIEKWTVGSRSIALPLGMICGTTIALGAMYFGYNLIMADKSAEGFIAIISGIAPLVIAYLHANREQKDERK